MNPLIRETAGAVQGLAQLVMNLTGHAGTVFFACDSLVLGQEEHLRP